MLRREAPDSRLLAGAATAIAALTLVVAGCGSDGSDGTATAASGEGTSGDIVDISGTEPVGEVLAGSVAPLVTCQDWNGADEAERLATIADVRAQVNRRDDGLTEPELTDEEASEVFDGACRPDYAFGFRLYKLYARAAGFVTLDRALDG